MSAGESDETDSDYDNEVLQYDVEHLLDKSFEYFLYLNKVLNIYLKRSHIDPLCLKEDMKKLFLEAYTETDVLVILSLLVKYFAETERERFNVVDC